MWKVLKFRVTLQIQKTRKLAILMLSILKLNTKLKIRTMYCAYAVNLAYPVKTKGFEFQPVFLVLLSSQLMFFSFKFFIREGLFGSLLAL